MTNTFQPICTIESAAKKYVESRGKSTISSTAAIRALRSLISDCPLSDHQIADLVAREAIDRKMIVSFDGETASSLTR